MEAHRIGLALVTAMLVLTGGCAGEPRRAGGAASGTAASSATEPLLAFTATTLDGKAFDGRSLAGKPTVLWFWAPWCPTCLSQAPGVRAAAEQYAGKVNIVGVAGLASADTMPDFVRMAKLEALTHLADEPGEVWRRFGVREQSVLVLLDANGTVVSQGRIAAADIPGRVAALVP